MHASRAWALAIVLGTVATAGSARAYCRTSTCQQGECSDPPAGCKSCEGALPLYWPNSCVSYSVHEAGSPEEGISAALTSQIVQTAFQRWISAPCPGGGNPSIGVFDFGFVSCDKQEYNQDDGNANIWVFRDGGWPHDNSGQTLALTTLTFNVETGAIFDADVEINSFDNDFTLTGETPVIADFESVIVHEAGHFLGLAHSCDTEATMWESYLIGNTFMRDLAPDDIAGICEIYPPGEEAESCDPTPRHGYSPVCGEDQDEGCCTTAPGRPGRHGAWALGLVLAGIGLFGARRRAARAIS